MNVRDTFAFVRPRRPHADRLRARRRIRLVLSAARRRPRRAHGRGTARRARGRDAPSRSVPQPVRRPAATPTRRAPCARPAPMCRCCRATARRFTSRPPCATASRTSTTATGPSAVRRSSSPTTTPPTSASCAMRSPDTAAPTRRSRRARTSRCRARSRSSQGARDAPVIVETERVATSPLTRALQEHARAGAPTTLVVARASRRSRQEASAIKQLAADGVDRARGRVEPEARARRRHRVDRLRKRDGRLGPNRRSAGVGDAHARSRARRRGRFSAGARPAVIDALTRRLRAGAGPCRARRRSPSRAPPRGSRPLARSGCACSCR